MDTESNYFTADCDYSPYGGRICVGSPYYLFSADSSYEINSMNALVFVPGYSSNYSDPTLSAAFIKIDVQLDGLI